MNDSIEERLTKAEHINSILSRAYIVQQDTMELLYDRVLDLEKKINEEILKRVEKDAQEHRRV